MIKNSTIAKPRNFAELSKKPQLFTGLSEKALQQILESSTLQDYKAGHLLVQQGDQPTHVYFIVEGRLRTLRANRDGGEATIRMLGQGEVCMEAVLFMRGPSPIAVQVVDDAQLMLIPGGFIKRFVLQDHQFATNLLKIVTHHYKTAMHQIDAMAIKSPVQRVGYYFLQKHMEQNSDTQNSDTQNSDTMEFELPFKKSTIANHLGMTPETFSRALSQIKKMGIDIKGEKIRLKDAYALCHFCDLDTAHECTLATKEDCPHCPTHAGIRY
ncbi:MAG: Crp/Fnr family transcriptional regulator [Pseudomonadota bacterium]